MKTVLIPNIHFVASKSKLDEFFNHLVKQSTQLLSYKFAHHDRSIIIEVKGRNMLKYLQKKFVKRFEQYITMYYETSRSQDWFYQV